MRTDADLLILAGVTAVGKTALALDWAERVNAEILSCDSLLFYRGMNVGTAKPSSEELSRVPHHGVNLVEPAEPFDVARYVRYAQTVVEDVRSRGRRLLVTGGSGFYLKSFFTSVADEVVVSEEVRAEVIGLEAESGLEGMTARLRELNPVLPDDLDLFNPRRVARALERCLASGETLLVLRERFRSRSGPFGSLRKFTCLLERSPEDLEQRVRKRTTAMLAAGLVEEVKSLRERGLRKNPSAARAVGYRETLAMLDGELPRLELEESIVRSTLQLAAKQRKWFRNQLEPDLKLFAVLGETFEVESLPLAPEP